MVSTIIPVHDRPRLVEAAVGSVLAQSHRPIEVVVVDDASTDETPAVLDGLRAAHSEVTVVHRPVNGGAGLARESGRAVVRGEFVQYLDSDDLLAPRKFEIQVAALRAHPDCGIAYGKTRLLNENDDVVEAPLKGTGTARDHLFPALLVERWWSTHTPLYRRSVCDAIGPWSDMRTGEDWEYEARAGATGVRLVHCPEFVCDTRRRASGHLTGGPMRPETLRDLVRLVSALRDGASRAGVAAEAPEMAHLSRWAFSLARQAAAANLRDAADEALRVARASAPRSALDVHVYSLLASALGSRMASRVGGLYERVRHARRPGRS
jgi:hypothetical protein